MIELSGFGVALLFIVGGVAFILVTIFVSMLLRPVRPNEEKRTTYESGEEPVKSAWTVFNVRFYVVALIFLLFETELVFLFPWAIIFADRELNAATEGLWGLFSLVETFIFIGILLLGLVYVWKKGMLDWPRPVPAKPQFDSPIPASAYDRVNQQTHQTAHGAS